ncbi:MAG: molybdopterin-dependent oxidoreductase [Terriglobales bacterium]
MTPSRSQGRNNLARLLVASIFALALAAAAAAQTLTLTTADGHSTTLSAAQIAAAAQVTISTDDRGTPAKFEGVPLATVLTMAGVQLGDSLRGARLTEVLLATAADGYKVAFALAEIDPAFAVREIILADKRDGKPLDAKEGPFRIVAPGDKRPARWIRQVTELKVVVVK